MRDDERAKTGHRHLCRIGVDLAPVLRGISDDQWEGVSILKIEGVIREVLDATEVVAVVTMGDDGPHMVASWGDYMRELGFEDDIILLPAGYYRQTEQNLCRDSKIQILVGSRRVQGSRSPGQGCVLAGRGEVLTSGPLADKAKAKFPWARGVLVIHVEEARTQL